MLNGIMIVDKPEGFTSHDVVAKMRGILKTRRIGHAGTLDPMATGVLVLFIGSSTRAIDKIPNHDKAYTASFQLGVATDTQDITGEVLYTKPVNVTKEQVLKAVQQNFTGNVMQIPPMYSAVQVNGKRLYDLARKGIEIERDAREITVYENELLDFDEQKGFYKFHIKCSKGTYIRTICNDLGEFLGTGASLSALRRTKANGFGLEKAVTLEQVEQLAKSDRLDEIIIPVDEAFKEFERLDLDKEKARLFYNGVPMWLSQFDIKAEDQWLRIYGPDNVFIGIAQASSEHKQFRGQKRFIREVSF